MSTSPSWFDQEKFSRLVKKVGPKAVPGASSASAPAAVVRAPITKSPEKETKRLQRSAEVPPPVPVTAKPRTVSLPAEPPIRADSPGEEEKGAISSPFPTPLAPPEPRQVSPLARRTTPLPDLKSIFEYENPSGREASSSQPLPGRPALTPSPAESADEGEKGEEMNLEEEAIPSWPLPIGFGEQVVLKPAKPDDDFSQLSREELSSRVQELSRAADERDAAQNEVKMLRAQLQQADEIIEATGIPGANLEEMARTIDERDAARRDYANLREQFENWKAAQGGGKSDSSADASSQEAEELRTQARALENTVANLKQELAAVQGQITQSRDQATAAQRGLALSQKALQETRDALREASEGYSLAKSNVESLKNECSSLVQQNVSLQAQYEQVTRELAAEKASRGGSED